MLYKYKVGLKSSGKTSVDGLSSIESFYSTNVPPTYIPNENSYFGSLPSIERGYILELVRGITDYTKAMATYRKSNHRTRLKALTIALVMCLGLYPAVELTRVIWSISYVYDPGRLTTWVAETIIIWVLYLSIIPVLTFSLGWPRADKKYRNENDLLP